MKSEINKNIIPTAEYIENMLGDLSRMSEDINAPFLGYLIEMAIVEAGDIVVGKRKIAGNKHENKQDEITKIEKLYMIADRQVKQHGK